MRVRVSLAKQSGPSLRSVDPFL
ncbi:hypothetical protein BN1263140004 [Stenotrophomonas indicatrix]|nr:hypothetical protein BN1263140004 [Stenotrophomonas indicatrix]